jgi:hypothetical protein
MPRAHDGHVNRLAKPAATVMTIFGAMPTLFVSDMDAAVRFDPEARGIVFRGDASKTHR